MLCLGPCMRIRTYVKFIVEICTSIMGFVRLRMTLAMELVSPFLDENRFKFKMTVSNITYKLNIIIYELKKSLFSRLSLRINMHLQLTDLLSLQKDDQ
ncbi:hypothetical protein T4D_13463 [Trichinella pseudospiralis]|uniref:Uncharacterized protein n=1 Tax=Trichinella pseudospiralis TaxID=6337 RepID=A0A0V1FK96_TRIPS|nr:hypothetical protein T4D_13463 [Trichinella pseudospiralis]